MTTEDIRKYYERLTQALKAHNLPTTWELAFQLGKLERLIVAERGRYDRDLNGSLMRSHGLL